YTAQIDLSVYDVAGNNDTVSKEIPVYGVMSENPDNFNVVSDEETIPQKINRMTASLLPNPPGYKVMVPFKLTGGGENIEVLQYDIKDCLVEGDERAYQQLFEDQKNPTPEPLPTLEPVTQEEETNYAELTLSRFRPESLNNMNSFRLNCSIDIYQKIDDTVYDTPEEENISVKMGFTDSALGKEPGEEVLDKIERERDKIGSFHTFIEDSKQLMDKLKQWCNIATQVVSVWNVFATIEGIGIAIESQTVYDIGCYPYEFLGKNVISWLYYGNSMMDDSQFDPGRCGAKMDAGIQGMGSSEEKLGDEAVSIDEQPDKVSGALNQWGKDDGFWPGLRNICGFVSCEYTTELADDIQRYTGGDVGAGSDEEYLSIENASEMGGVNIGPVRAEPQNSLIMSIAGLCLPGIITNLNKYMSIQCRYVKCLKDLSLQGAPTYICDSKKSQSKCLFFFNEVGETFGILKLAKNIGEDIGNIGANLAPNTLKLVVDKAICSQPDKKVSKAVKVFACDVPRAIFNTIDSWKRFKAIGRYAEEETWQVSDSGKGICEQVLSDDFLNSTEENTTEENNETE
ncbi:MAG: hypothetical protein ACQEP1_04960, partial [Nanobdellota archaeon]